MQDIEKKYRNISTEELLDDIFFIQSIKRDCEYEKKFWLSLIEKGIIDKATFDEASNVLLGILKKEINTRDENSENALWDRINSTISHKKRSNRKKIYFTIGSIAASIAIIIAFNFFLKKDKDFGFDRSHYTNLMEGISRSSDSAQLILSDLHIPLHDDDIKIDNTQEGNIIVADMQYEKDSIGFNQLIIPYGKRSTLTLEDGTKLWVNANSHVIYPAKFGDNIREIFVEGEVFADVAKEVNRPFVVKTLNSSIEVLGTSFNINARKASDSEAITLITGSIKLKHKDKRSYTLKPNEEFLATSTESLIRTVDPTNTIAWIDGYYKFSEEQLSTILNKLSDFYGYEIHVEQELRSIKCTGGIDLREDIEPVIKGLTRALNISYKINKKTISIY